MRILPMVSQVRQSGRGAKIDADFAYGEAEGMGGRGGQNRCGFPECTVRIWAWVGGEEVEACFAYGESGPAKWPRG